MSDEDEALTQRPASKTEAQRLEAWVAAKLHGASRHPSNDAALFAATDLRPSAPEDRSTEAQRLEQWIASRLGARVTRGKTVDDVSGPVDGVVATPFASREATLEERSWSPASTPRDRSELPRAEEPSAVTSRSPTARAKGFNPIPMGVYARIKVELWRSKEPPSKVLERHDLDEVRWRAHEHWLRAAMTAAARTGDADFLVQLTAALRAARAEARVASAPTQSDVDDESDLERFCRIRAAVELAGEEAEEETLRAEKITRLDWDDMRIEWSERLRHDPELARRVRRLTARARREKAASLEDVRVAAAPP